MKHLKIVSMVVLGIVLFSSCEETDITAFSEGLRVSVGRECGWCVGHEQLTISTEISSYYYDYACGDSEDIPERFFQTPSDDWAEINTYLNKGVFETIDLSTCSVCADGCDFIITVIDSDYEHEIRFDQLEKIQNEATRTFAERLVTQLDGLNGQN